MANEPNIILGNGVNFPITYNTGLDETGLTSGVYTTITGSTSANVDPGTYLIAFGCMFHCSFSTIPTYIDSALRFKKTTGDTVIGSLTDAVSRYDAGTVRCRSTNTIEYVATAADTFYLDARLISSGGSGLTLNVYDAWYTITKVG